MNRTGSGTEGYTLVEIMVGLSLTALVVAFVWAGYGLVNRLTQEWRENVQTGMAEHKASMQFKRDVWLATGSRSGAASIEFLQANRNVRFHGTDGLWTRNGQPMPAGFEPEVLEDGRAALRQETRPTLRMEPRVNARWSPVR